MECVAGWKEGSSSYLIGRTRPLKTYPPRPIHNSDSIEFKNRFFQKIPLDNSHSNLHQPKHSKYQCFRYETHMEKGHYVIKMSQSNSWRDPFQYLRLELILVSNKLKLLVYSRDENGNILTSSQEFSADSCNSVASPKASWSSEKLTPSSEVDFKLKGRPEALCGYSIVDKSVDLVPNPNKVTKPKLQVSNSLNELIF